MAEHALPYHEPGIVTILILSSFLLLLNLIGSILDSLIYCGLLGQLFIGVAWGAPAAQWISKPTQQALVELGYLGLILLVYEGGLSTNFQALKSNLFLSVFVALTGIAAPIGISFILMWLVDATPLQAFAAGAALCSTSLGTTFTVLKTSGLTRSRLGVILTSAAMFDDVVGLVMVQVISNLGAADSSFDAITVVRPIMVSVAFAVVIPLVCRFVIKPLAHRSTPIGTSQWRVLSKSQMAFLFQTAILTALVASSSYAGSSNLFAAYLAGACISWYDSEVVEAPQRRPRPQQPAAADHGTDVQGKVDVRELQASQDTDAIHLAPGSVAPSTPQPLPSPAASETGEPMESKAEITVDDQPNGPQETDAVLFPPTAVGWEKPLQLRGAGRGMSTWQVYYEKPVSTVFKPLFFASIGFSIPISQMFAGSVIWRGIAYATLMAFGKLLCGVWLVRFSSSTSPTNGLKLRFTGRKLPKPKSLYPASILGCAMVARGEIGFLISSVAESRGIFSSAGTGGSSELFLIMTWAIMLCTIAGPILVGLLTRRVHRLQVNERGSSGGREDPVGVGVSCRDVNSK